MGPLPTAIRAVPRRPLRRGGPAPANLLTAAARSLHEQRGSVLIAVLLATTLMLALGTMLALTMATETAVASHHRDAIEAWHAADAALAWAAHDLAREANWDAVLGGVVVSSLADGAPGPRRVAGGTSIDLAALTNDLRCGVPTSCSPGAMDAVTAARPWGRNNPRWQLFVHGPAAGMPGVDSSAYVVVWVGDDPAETDGAPQVDGGEPEGDETGTDENPGRGRLRLLAHAYGPGAARRVAEASLARTPGRAGVRLLGWRPAS